MKARTRPEHGALARLGRKAPAAGSERRVEDYVFSSGSLDGTAQRAIDPYDWLIDQARQGWGQ